MKRKIYLLFLLLITLNGWAQDFKPGDQAQNLTEQKNVMVDYSTGLFHYTVPIYKLKSGNYELPISFDYIGKGVKDSDISGQIGYNWTLSTGGIVTRTMRGGFPDENISFGYLRTEHNSIPLQDDVKNVALRKRDGESDIFTAVFNGKKVDFIIRADANRKIYTEPLEKTDVRIECENTSTDITGWIITDNNGDRYIYRQIEMNTDIQRVDVSTSNAIPKSSYNSAWYLTRIIPYNGAPIEFIYKANVSITENRSQNKINMQSINNSYTIIYNYGKPVREQPFDFEKYKVEFQEAIEEVRYRLRACSQETLLREADAQMANYFNYANWNYQPLGSTIVTTNSRIIGLLADIKGTTNASLELENTLKNLANYCNQLSDFNARIAGTNLTIAANCIHNCMVETRSITQKKIAGGSCYDVLSPVLTMIIAPEQIVKFENYNNQYLTKIGLYNREEVLLSSVAITDPGHILDELSFSDKDGKETSKIKFDYYKLSDFPPLPSEEASDKWGYTCTEKPSGKEYDMLVALNSLKGIILADGGKIKIEYEKNQAERYSDYGGIRLKSLIFNDGIRNDTLSYGYPLPGTSVYKTHSNGVSVNYINFSDMIIYDRVRLEGYPIVAMGNNGLYYPSVTESISGKGMNAYRYQIATYSSTVTCYPYWMTSLLSEKAVYNNNGDLEQMTKYTYETLSANNSALPQMQPSDYYLDGEDLKSYYNSQTTNYIKGDELYKNNIEPRLSPENTSRFYYLRYGEKTVLKEEIEYRLDEKTPYCRTEYHYDNPNSIFPTKIARTESNGHNRSTVYKRVADMADDIDPIIDKMKQSNLSSFIVKQRDLCDKQLISESVWRYNINEQSVIIPFETLTYIPDTFITYSESEEEKELFTYGESNYISSASYYYVNNKCSSLPVEKNERTEKKSYAYDDFGKLLLECDAMGATASDLYKSIGNGMGDKQNLVPLLNNLKSSYLYFKSISEKIHRDVDDEQFLDYFNSWDHELVIQLAEELVNFNSESNKAQNCYEIISANENALFNDFKQEYDRLIQLYPKFGSLAQFVRALQNIIEYDDGQKLFELLYITRYTVDNPNKSIYSIKPTLKPEIKHLKLYRLKGNDQASVYITHAGGKTEYIAKSIPCEYSSLLKVYDIDLNAYVNVTSISVPSEGIYTALVPEGASFKATSYNSDGTAYAKFDQSGNAEFYTYDSAGRVTQIKDQYGNILKEYKYNKIINK